MITGVEQPDAGSITIGDTVQLSYVNQSRDSLDDDATAATGTAWRAASSRTIGSVMTKNVAPASELKRSTGASGGRQK